MSHPTKSIRERREAIGCSIAELARRAGIHWDTLNRIERGRTKPHPLTLDAVEAALYLAEQEKQREDA